MAISKRRIAEIDAIPDEAIDVSDIPEVPAEFFRTAKVTAPGTRRDEPDRRPNGRPQST